MVDYDPQSKWPVQYTGGKDWRALVFLGIVFEVSWKVW